MTHGFDSSVIDMLPKPNKLGLDQSAKPEKPKFGIVISPIPSGLCPYRDVVCKDDTMLQIGRQNNPPYSTSLITGT
jgi:hypothetical protein